MKRLVILRENFKKEILLDIIRLAILPEHAGPEHESVKILTLPFFMRTEKSMNEKTMPAVELEAKDLPAYCPNPTMPLWSSHPRVFLDFDHDGNAKCPYCGTQYRLKPGTVVGHH
jgi:uncharacterized Zn-finger protein